MKFSSVPFVSELLVELRSIGNISLVSGDDVRIKLGDTSLYLFADDRVGLFKLANSEHLDWLTQATLGEAYLAEVISADQKLDTVQLRVMRFKRRDIWPSVCEVGLDDQSVNDVGSKFMNGTSDVSKILAWLHSQVRVEGQDSRLVVQVGGGDDLNLSAFRLIGGQIVVDVEMANGKLAVRSVTRRPRRAEGNFILIQGEIKFADATRLGKLSQAELQVVQRLSEVENSYLAIWNEYNEIERALVRKAADHIGWARYDFCRLDSNGDLEFSLVHEERSDIFRQQLGKEVVGLEVGETVAIQSEIAVQKSLRAFGEGRISASGTLILTPNRRLSLQEVPLRGKIAGAYTLDQVRIDRRDDAKRAISEAATFPVRQLGLLLADRPLEDPGRTRSQEPMSQKVREILGGAPTEAQIRAIDLAINSNDIVLIQGPPGTGKTRVIAAIQARLTEISKKSAAASKRVLLTSYQHDAVGNLVEASSDGMLPAVRLGRNNTQDFEATLSPWRGELLKRLNDKYESSDEHILVRTFDELRLRKIAFETHTYEIGAAIELLQWIAKKVELVGETVARRANSLAVEFEHNLGSASGTRRDESLFRLARQLRTTIEGFEDDGVSNANSAIQFQAFHDKLNTQQRQQLLDVVNGAVSSELAINWMESIKNDVLDRLLSARFRAGILVAIPAVQDILNQALNSARWLINTTVSDVVLAVEYFRSAMKKDPDLAFDSMRNYTRALAATCQQSVSSEMRATQNVPFDTVIVDEAARANPLDLMVPMSLASGRIILVGDHRQLPQLLDTNLVSQFGDRHDPSVVDAVLSKSLFEQLFNKLKDDGLTRGVKRVVTLDQQFRSHPVLGTFISEQFYAPFSEPLSNGAIDAMNFSHTLPDYKNAVCAWIDVKRSAGTESKDAFSISRKCEADVVVEELRNTLQEDSTLTCGVITFYSGQVRVIWEAMFKAGLALRSDNDYILNPSIPWLHTASGSPRVRIGTVDAFQGREFDIVFLSTVRSNSGRRGQADYGFLVLPNRLCVAMSRQRRLLVVIGDAEMFTTEAGRRAVPALAAFYEMTGGSHGIRRDS